MFFCSLSLHLATFGFCFSFHLIVTVVSGCEVNGVKVRLLMMRKLGNAQIECNFARASSQRQLLPQSLSMTLNIIVLASLAMFCLRFKTAFQGDSGSRYCCNGWALSQEGSDRMRQNVTIFEPLLCNFFPMQFSFPVAGFDHVEAGKFVLTELQKEHQRDRLAEERSRGAIGGDGCDGQKSEHKHRSNGWTLYLKDHLAQMVAWCDWLILELQWANKFKVERACHERTVFFQTSDLEL